MYIAICYYDILSDYLVYTHTCTHSVDLRDILFLDYGFARNKELRRPLCHSFIIRKETITSFPQPAV